MRLGEGGETGRTPGEERFEMCVLFVLGGWFVCT